VRRLPAVSNQITKPQPSDQREQPHPRPPVISVPRLHRGHASASVVGDAPFAFRDEDFFAGDAALLDAVPLASFGATVRGFFAAFGFAACSAAHPAVRAGSRTRFAPGPLWPPGTLGLFVPGDGSSTTRDGSRPFGNGSPPGRARYSGARSRVDNGAWDHARFGGANLPLDDGGRLGDASPGLDAGWLGDATSALGDGGPSPLLAPVFDHARFGGAKPVPADGDSVLPRDDGEPDHARLGGAKPALGAVRLGAAERLACIWLAGVPLDGGGRLGGALPDVVGAPAPRIASTTSVT